AMSVKINADEARFDWGLAIYDYQLNLVEMGYKRPEGTGYSFKLGSGWMKADTRNLLFFERPDKSASIWDADTGKHYVVPEFFNKRGYSITVNESANTLLVRRDNGVIELWDANTFKLQTSVSAVNMKEPVFTSGTVALAIWQQGGAVTLWTLRGVP